MSKPHSHRASGPLRGLLTNDEISRLLEEDDQNRSRCSSKRQRVGEAQAFIPKAKTMPVDSMQASVELPTTSRPQAPARPRRDHNKSQISASDRESIAQRVEAYLNATFPGFERLTEYFEN